ncbi:MAG: anthranilate synthase component I family protein [Myxococcota bacterium]|nr:anthranilate synthase component I family protein [Myxococcota bacterium]
MISPTAEDFQADYSAARKPSVLPVFREVLADLDTPVSAFLKVCPPPTSPMPHAFLLESVEGGERWARYSVIGMDPAFVVRAIGNTCERVENGDVVHTEQRDDPLEYLEEQLSRLQWLGDPSLPPFVGGGIGWIGWEAVRWWESLPSRHTPDKDYPLVWSVPRTLLIFDNLRHCIQVVALVFTEEHTDGDVAYKWANRVIDDTIRRLRGPLPSRPPEEARPHHSVQSNFNKTDFLSAVENIQDWILAGDCIQVVLSQRFELNYSGQAVDLYRALRAVNPSPYMFYLRYPEQQVIGASPEVMVRVSDNEAVVAPIAGTRPRGATAEEDQALATELLEDPKEVAEHVMLVDLARNDLGRIAQKGTVEVRELMEIQRFSHVMHIVSEVRGELSERSSAYDAIRATLPAGTLSGAPKIRAMEIIDELEPCSRSLYGGAVGWISFRGETDLAIAIRTAWRNQGHWQLQVGAGIVADSIPEMEYQETLNKAAGLLAAIEKAGKGL